MKNVLELKTTKMGLANIESKLSFGKMEEIVGGYVCNPHHQVFIAACFGMMLGGWGSLITAAVVQEAIDQNGGKCI